MNTVTFVVIRKPSPDGRYPFTILRISDDRQEAVSFHATLDEATEAAQRYVAEARFARLNARIYHRDWLVQGAKKPPQQA